MKPFSHVHIVLVRPQHSGNIGATARSIMNHGLGRLFLVDPPAFDPDRARWMAPHSQVAINQAALVQNIREAVSESDYVIAATARNRKWDIPQCSIPDFIQLIGTKRVSVLFGPEDSGLSNEDIKHAHAIMTFPTHAHQSLNLSQAVNILGAHCMASLPIEQEEPLPPPPPRHITMKLQEEIVQRAMEVLDSCDYLSRRSPNKVYNQLIQLIERSQLTHDDTAMLKGMTNKIFHTIRVHKTPSMNNE